MSLTPSRAQLKQMVHFAKTQDGPPTVKRFMQKYKPELRGQALFIGDKVFIPRESVTDVLEKVGKRGMPMRSHRGAQQWVKDRFVGITNREVSEFVNLFRIYEMKRLKKDENINRYKISSAMLTKITEALQGKQVDDQINKFINKFYSSKLDS